MVWLWLLACSVEESPSSEVDTALPEDVLTAEASKGAATVALAALSEGYACEDHYHYVAADAGHQDATARLGVSVDLADIAATAPPGEGDRYEGPVPDHRVSLLVGSCLSTPGCTDSVVWDCNQDPERSWVGTGGTLVLEHTATGVRGELRDLELTEAGHGGEPRDGAEPVLLGTVPLAERPYWTE